MDVEIRLNLSVLESYELSVNEFLTIWKFHLKGQIDYNDTMEDIKSLQDKKFLKIIENEKTKKYVLREKAHEVIEFLSTGMRRTNTRKKKDKINVDVLTRIVEFRTKWKGLKLGSMGSAEACKVKLTRWMKENPSYTFDEILAAVDLYIDSLRGDYRFLQRADYFIYKQNTHKEEESNLSAFIDEVSNGATTQSDWTTKLN